MWHQLRSTRMCIRRWWSSSLDMSFWGIDIPSLNKDRACDLPWWHHQYQYYYYSSMREICILQWMIEIIFSVSLNRIISVLNWLLSESVTCDVRDKCSLIEIYIHRVCSVDATGIQSVRTQSFSNVAILRNCSIDLRCESMRMKKKKENDSKQNLGTNEFTLFSAKWRVELDDEYVRFHLSSVIGKLKEKKNGDRTWEDLINLRSYLR